MLAAATRAAIAEALNAAAYGQRTATARRLAALYGISRATVYRLAKLGGAKRPRPARKPEYREWTRLAVALAHRAPKPMPLDVAIRGGVAAGHLPPEAAAMPMQSAYRIARELGLTPTRRRRHRLHADYPMQAIQIDGSSSEHLLVDAALGDGPLGDAPFGDAPLGDDYRLRLHRRPYASGYKNKPLKADRQRVLLYSLWDMCTGYVLSRYTVAQGENALDAMDFLCWALAGARAEDARVVLHGVPDDLWSDQGPLWKSAAARDLLERLDVHLVTSEPYAKERMGGVERGHRTRWARFERALFLRDEATIRLSELNARLREYELEWNAARPSRTAVAGRSLSRTAAWVALTNTRAADRALRKLPANPMETMARAARRKIDVNGIVRWGGVEYECADWHERWVIARRAMDGSGDLSLEDEATGERRPARRYRRRAYGEIRGAPATPLDKLLGAATETAGADVYAPSAAPPNVVPLPARSATAAPLDNPLAGQRCRSLNEAMRLFTTYYPHPMSAASRARVIEQIETSGLDRQAVITLAQEISALTGRA